jgi:hypothetical protein
VHEDRNVLADAIAALLTINTPSCYSAAVIWPGSISATRADSRAAFMTLTANWQALPFARCGHSTTEARWRESL